MKLKRIVSVVTIIAMVMTTAFASFADPTTDFHTGLLPGESESDGATGPVVEEYYVYKEDKKLAPGSLLGDVDFSTIGRGLFFDGTDFYFYIDTGVMATNYMFTIEGDRFFFGEDGKMVKNQLVNYNDEIYFFDDNGAMYKNRWYSDEQFDESDNTFTYVDYYFGPTGRAYRAMDGGLGLVVKTIDGQKYGFNVDGEKLEGYYDQNGVKIEPDTDPAYVDCVYYFDPEENGAALSGWHYYEGSVRSEEYDDNEEIVLYFDEKTCKKVHAKASYANEGRCISRIIDGQRYMFDHNGVRKNSWYIAESGRGTHSNAKYFSDEYDGNLQKGWFQAVPGSKAKHGEDLVLDVNKKKHSDDEDCWFYAGKNGRVLKKTIRKIGNYIYAFDDDGVMQQDAFVKVKNGAFIKAYETDDLTRANILFDPLEYGGNADPDPDGVGNPSGILDKKKGLLKTNEGEQWMFFMGEYAGESKTGAQVKQNAQVKIELSDVDIYFIQNGVGGYSNCETHPTLGDITTVVERSGVFIQNGVVLRPDKDDGSYGIVRRNPHKERYGGRILNYKNKYITIEGREFYKFMVVNSAGKPVTSQNKSFKTSNGDYIYVGMESNFIGCYPYEGKFYNKTPGNLVDEEGKAVPASNEPCWAYKKEGVKQWTYGLPPESSRLDCEYLFLNFGKNSDIETGDFTPYTYGEASVIYEEAP